ncbi:MULTISPECIES: hypothetical protein [Streptomyces]|uniref:hypothetical protein n=1 Tax=Streptomyces TaxID=1883 RepID=UPI00131CA5F6|nr:MULTISPECIES: hypothetical protein [Streptomyces]
MNSGVSSATLITVSVITAASSLIAAGITALIAYLIAKRNLTHAADMAAADREAKAAEQYRITKREAYAAYSTAALTTLRDCAMVKGALKAPRTKQELDSRRTTARDSYNAMVVTLGMVRLEDSAGDVTNRATTLQQMISLYIESMAKHLRPDATATQEQITEVEQARVAASTALSAYERVARADLRDHGGLYLSTPELRSSQRSV